MGSLRLRWTRCVSARCSGRVDAPAALCASNGSGYWLVAMDDGVWQVLHDGAVRREGQRPTQAEAQAYLESEHVPDWGSPSLDRVTRTQKSRELAAQIEECEQQSQFAMVPPGPLEQANVALAEGASAAGAEQATIKAAEAAGPALMNWPPSRGPMPPWMTAKPVLRMGKVEQTDIARGASNGARPAGRPTIYDVWCQVEDLLDVPPEVANRLIQGMRHPGGAHPNTGGHRKARLDNWLWLSSVGDDTPCVNFPRALDVPRVTLTIEYPLVLASRLTIHAATVERQGPDESKAHLELSLGLVLWAAAQEYRRIYDDHEKYGVWGHALGDLGFEGLVVYRDGTCELQVGS